MIVGAFAFPPGHWGLMSNRPIVYHGVDVSADSVKVVNARSFSRTISNIIFFLANINKRSFLYELKFRPGHWFLMNPFSEYLIPSSDPH